MFKRFTAAVTLAAIGLQASSAPLPRLEQRGHATQFMVDDKPFLMLGGELHNSSASSNDYMAPIWPRLKKMNLNTVVTTVSWELTEPSEGRFDFSSLDSQLEAARAQGLRLVVIWFGAYKNARSTYAPGWVRKDTSRFPRVAINQTKPEFFNYKGAMPNPVLSPFSAQLQTAERRAFSALAAHLKVADPDHTVVMLQVDNEVGLLGDSKDRSPIAQAAWNAQVPAQLMTYLARHRAALRPELLAVWGRQQFREKGTWEQVFGKDWQAEEIFMAWGYGAHIEALAQGARKELPLPMYVNAWLGPQPGQPQAGDYPSGGPVPRVLDIWKAAAPTLSLLAPDIYVDDVTGVLKDYHRPDNPIFVPEAKFKTAGLFWGVGKHKALGWSVFGVEDGAPNNQVAQAYGILASMSDLVLRAQERDTIRGVLLDHDEAVTESLGGYGLSIRRMSPLLKQIMLDAGVTAPSAAPAGESKPAASAPASANAKSFGMIIAGEPSEFYLVGQDYTVDFSRNGRLAEVDFVEEGSFKDGKWVPGRRLNGDERLLLLPVQGIGVLRMKLLEPAP